MEYDLNIFPMQDDLIFFQMKNDLIFFQIDDNLNLIQMEYDLIFLQMEDNLKRKQCNLKTIKILLVPMGVLAHGSVKARPSARRSINTSGMFWAHMSEGGKGK